MSSTLASVDAVVWVSILVKAFAYAMTLSAVGSVLVTVWLSKISDAGRSSLRRTIVFSVAGAAIFSILRIPIRASFLMGGTWGGALDPAILELVVQSPLGTSVAVRLVGLALILCAVWQSPAGNRAALLGALIASLSFALRGHTLDEPRMILGALLTVHILGLSFWVGAFAPLARSARDDPPAQAGAVAHEFGKLALWVVGLLVFAGGLMLALLGAATPAALSGAYGQILAFKLFLFAGVLALAAVNKLSLTPALLAATPGAGTRLRRSIRLEALLVAVILVVTATLTTVSSPPGNGPGDRSSFLPSTRPHAPQSLGDAS